ncbi:hypothetical protein BOX15_Mlig024767g1 [Macrostomum lignano]|uniref:B box-type domain-containing protein n=1 Tax=Macrostomum lignano TaxID=282301 RepID=A0A267GSP5_9PLAT|nr:hypothetical protein BOX15_Mlig024767g1 [Macrostomum lignano]
MAPKKPTKCLKRHFVKTWSPGHRSQRICIGGSAKSQHDNLSQPLASKVSRTAAENASDSADIQPDTVASECREYESRVQQSNQAWDECKDSILRAFSRSMSVETGGCMLCDSRSASFRCSACHLLQVCEPCLNQQHRHNPPHSIEHWDGSVYVHVPTKAVLRRRCSCDASVSVRQVSLVLDNGLQENAHVEICDVCADLQSTLISQGFWPVQSNINRAIKPSAIRISVLLRIESTMQKCATSLFSACNALAAERSLLWCLPGANIYRRLNSFGSMRAFRSLLTSVQWQGKPGCPACFTVSSQSDTLDAPIVLQLDGCFGMRHRSSAGKSTTSTPSDTPVADFFLDTDLSREVSAAAGSCPNWRAGGRGQDVFTPKDEGSLDVFGLFATSCRHSSIVSLSDIVTHGERLNYAVTAVKAAAVKHQDTPIVVSYDIACKLQSHFRDNPRLRFAVPAFHAYGHNWQCQLQNNIRFLSDVGLTDGEACERLWSHFRRYAAQTKEMTLANRRAFLNHLATSINVTGIQEITSWFVERKRLLEKTQKKCDNDAEKIAEELALPPTLSSFLAYAESCASRFCDYVLAEQSQSFGSREAVINDLARLETERQHLVQHLSTYRGQQMAKRLKFALKKLDI